MIIFKENQKLGLPGKPGAEVKDALDAVLSLSLNGRLWHSGTSAPAAVANTVQLTLNQLQHWVWELRAGRAGTEERK